MDQKNLFIILSIGFMIMLIMGTVSFYWANQDIVESSTSRVNSSTHQKQKKAKRPSSTFDTKTVNFRDWKTFLNYEGPRKIMLGIEKKHDAVNYRKGPGTNYEVISNPTGGELLTQLDRTNSWYRTRRKNGQIGWIHKSLIRKLKVPSPIAKRFESNLPSLKKSSQELIPDSFEKHNQLEVNEEKVNLRQGPGTQFSVTGNLYQYERVRLLGKKKNWFHIKNHINQKGWVSASLVKPIWTDTKDKNEIVYLESTEISMAPQFQFRLNRINTKDTSAPLLEKEGNWHQIRINQNTIGWTHKRNIKKVLQSPIESQSDQVDLP